MLRATIFLLMTLHNPLNVRVFPTGGMGDYPIGQKSLKICSSHSPEESLLADSPPVAILGRFWAYLFWAPKL